MSYTNIIPIHPTPKFRPEDNRHTRVMVGTITKNYGGVIWVRDTLRRDVYKHVEPKAMSDYWKRVEEYMFRRW
jgi:hypothetical protein